MKNGNWKGILIMLICFALITIWPGPKHWYVGTIAFGLFMIWLMVKTLR